MNQTENYPLDRKVLEERLAAITNPANDKELSRVTRLGVIDQFLSDKNAEQVIKNAL